jgi:hypothetical protein
VHADEAARAGRFPGPPAAGPHRPRQGAWLYDFDGKRYLDGISSWWTNLFGHANPRINAALREQLETLEHVMLAGFTHQPVVELSERLSALTGGALGHAFYASDGASATEIALKMSFHYWRNVGRPEKAEFLCLAGSYHGETVGALAVTDVAIFKDAYAPLVRAATRRPLARFPLAEAGESPADVARRAAAALEAHLEAHGERIAALIVEPLVQGAAGMAMYDPEYLRLARALCDRYEVHLICDEIAVGCGRTGTFFAHEQAGHPPRPDVPVERHLRRLPAAVHRALHRRDLQRLPTTTRSPAPSCTRTATPATRWPAAPRWRRSTSSRSPTTSLRSTARKRQKSAPPSPPRLSARRRPAACATGAAWRCAGGHCFDIASQGYTHLLPVQNKRSRDPGDSKEMVAARRRFLDAGCYQPIAAAVARLALADMPPGQRSVASTPAAARATTCANWPQRHVTARPWPCLGWTFPSGQFSRRRNRTSGPTGLSAAMQICPCCQARSIGCSACSVFPCIPNSPACSSEAAGCCKSMPARTTCASCARSSTLA